MQSLLLNHNNKPAVWIVSKIQRIEKTAINMCYLRKAANFIPYTWYKSILPTIKCTKFIFKPIPGDPQSLRNKECF